MKLFFKICISCLISSFIFVGCNSSNQAKETKYETTKETETSTNIIPTEVTSEYISQQMTSTVSNNVNTPIITENDFKQLCYETTNAILFLLQNESYLDQNILEDFFTNFNQFSEIMALAGNVNRQNMYELYNKLSNINQKMNIIANKSGLTITQVITYNDFISCSKDISSSSINPSTYNAYINTILQTSEIALLLSQNQAYLDEQSLYEVDQIGNEVTALYETFNQNPLYVFKFDELFARYDNWLQRLKNICYRNNINISNIINSTN